MSVMMNRSSLSPPFLATDFEERSVMVALLQLATACRQFDSWKLIFA